MVSFTAVVTLAVYTVEGASGALGVSVAVLPTFVYVAVTAVPPALVRVNVVGVIVPACRLLLKEAVTAAFVATPTALVEGVVVVTARDVGAVFVVNTISTQ